MNVRSLSARMAITLAMSLCFSVTALAGFRQAHRTVNVNQTDRMASGQLAGARASTDTTQQIGCFTSVQDYSTAGSSSSGSVVQWGYCVAVATNGTTGFCYSSKPDLIAAMRNLQGDAFLEFYWNSNGECSLIMLTQSSTLEPKR